MATNDFLVFGGGAGANVITQVTYSGLAARTAGFSSGVAQSAQLNKVWRQSSIMAAVLAQFISDQTGQDALDDGTSATLLANLKKSMPGRLLRTTVYARVGGVQQVSVNGGAFTSTGATTFTALAQTTAVRIQCQGAGGGSGGSAATGAATLSVGGGGGGGSFAAGWFTSAFSGLAVTVGAGGTAGPAGSGFGGIGGTSSVGSIITSPGGNGSQSSSSAATSGGFFGGSAQSSAPTGGNIVAVRGAGGLYGTQWAGTSATAAGGYGGASVFGGGAIPGNPSATSAGIAGVNPGSGAAGAQSNVSSSAQAGATGADGIIIIEEFA